MKSIRTTTFKKGLQLSRTLRDVVTDDNVAKKRRALDRLERYFPPGKGVSLLPVSRSGFKGEWVTAPGTTADTVVLYLHGGGFVFYPKMYRDLIGRISAASRCRVFALDYSLAPEHKYPTAVHETVAAYKWLLNTYSPEHIAVAGDSAGGALVLSLIHSLRREKLPNPACVVVISPATDAMLSGPSIARNKQKDFFISEDALAYFVKAYFGDSPRDDPIGSPLYGSFDGFPPLLVHVDKNEIMYDDSARLVEKAKRAGVNVELYETTDMWHVYHLYARFVPEARRAIENIGQFIQARLGIKP